MTVSAAGEGAVKFSGSGLGTCSVVTLAQAVTTTDDRGTGPIDVATLRAFHFQAPNTIWALADETESLFSIDAMSGNRVRVSSSSAGTMVGAGGSLGTVQLALGNPLIWTIGGFAGGALTLASADPSTGNRTAAPLLNGPAAFAQADNPEVWLVPQSSFLVITGDNAFILYDPATDNSNTLSF
jgi:hypothetical protein